MNTATARINAIGQILAHSPALTITPEQMAQCIAAAGSAARREDQAAIANAGENKARTGDPKNRQLWFGLGGAAISIFACANLSGLVAREVAPVNWQWPERMAASMMDLPMWQAGEQLLATADPAAYQTIVGADRIVTANRKAIEGCSKAAVRKRQTVRCTIRIGPSL